MKEILIVLGAVIAVVVGFSFFMYALLGFGFWLFSDPMNWIPESYVAPPDPGIAACLERGGVPVRSAWNGTLKDCLEEATPTQQSKEESN